VDAFEELVALLLRREGYWTASSVKVELSKSQKLAIGRPSSPRWEVDLVAYRARTNELLAVECKSYLDSRGVLYRCGAFEPRRRYKLFHEARLRELVLRNLARQMVAAGACRPNPRVILCLAVGRMATRCERPALDAWFKRRRWRLLDDAWMRTSLMTASAAGYENDVVYVVAKLLGRGNGSSADIAKVAIKGGRPAAVRTRRARSHA
jgi:hypothetical protein